MVTLVGEERVGEEEGARRKGRKRGERMEREGKERNRGGRIKIPCLIFSTSMVDKTGAKRK